MTINLLLVEDETDLSSAIKQFLSTEGYLITEVNNYKDSLKEIKKNNFDLCVLDINLPDGNGNQLIDQFRNENEEAGVIIISANNLVSDKIISLDIGADDYLVKPFNLHELNARIRTVLRRKKRKLMDKITFNEIVIISSDYKAFVNQNNLPLTKKEFELLLYFVTNKEKLITKETLVSHLWTDLGEYDNYDFIYAHVKNLRRKLFIAGAKDYIQNIHSIGYKFASK